MAKQSSSYQLRQLANGAFPVPLHCWKAAVPEDCHTVIALHGFTGSGLDFEALATSPAGNVFNWICPDLPGHSQTLCPDLADAYVLPAVLNILHQIVTRFCTAKPSLIGYSMGGRIALQAAVNLPNTFRSLTTIGASPGIASQPERLQRRADDHRLALQILRDGSTAFADFWEKQPLIATQNCIQPDILTKLQARRRLKHPTGLAYALWCLGNAALPPLHSHLHLITIPCLFTAGELDTPFLHHATQMSLCLQHAFSYAIPQATHCAHLEKPGDFIQMWSQWAQNHC